MPNARHAPEHAAPAVGGNRKRRPQPLSRLQRHRDAPLVPEEGRQRGRRMKMQARNLSGTLVKGGEQMAVFDHLAQGLAVEIGGIEMQITGRVAIADPDFPDRLVIGEPRPHRQRLEKLHRGMGDRIRPPVEIRQQPRGRRHAVDHGDLQPGIRQRNRRRQTDETAANDDRVHRNCLLARHAGLLPSAVTDRP